MDFFVPMLFAHIIGDYFLQNNWIALNKSSNSLICAIHCFLYTLAVCTFTQFNIVWALFIFLSHYVVDRFSLGDVYLGLINGCSISNFIKCGVDAPKTLNKESQENFKILRGGFTSLVYVMVDNGFHLMTMYYFYKYVIL